MRIRTLIYRTLQTLWALILCATLISWVCSYYAPANKYGIFNNGRAAFLASYGRGDFGICAEWFISPGFTYHVKREERVGVILVDYVNGTGVTPADKWGAFISLPITRPYLPLVFGGDKGPPDTDFLLIWRDVGIEYSHAERPWSMEIDGVMTPVPVPIRGHFSVQIPCWLAVLFLSLMATPAAFSAALRHRRRKFALRQSKFGLCPTCTYDLRSHAPGDKCPECGTPILRPSGIAPPPPAKEVHP